MANRSYKGRRFELWLAAELSRWWTNGDRDDVFYHTHDSGGRATRRHAKGKKTYGLYGDIHAVDPIGKPLTDLVVIELKRGYNYATIADLLDKPIRAAEQTYEKWIEKAQQDAKAAEVPYWLLIHKRDKREPLLIMPREFMSCFPFVKDISRFCVNVEIGSIWVDLNITQLDKFLFYIKRVHFSGGLPCRNRKKKSG